MDKNKKTKIYNFFSGLFVFSLKAMATICAFYILHKLAINSEDMFGNDLTFLVGIIMFFFPYLIAKITEHKHTRLITKLNIALLPVALLTSSASLGLGALLLFFISFCLVVFSLLPLKKQKQGE